MSLLIYLTPYLTSSLLLCVESVRDAVGRKVKLSLRKRVKLEIKGDKMENRVLVSQLLMLPNHVVSLRLAFIEMY